MLTKQQLI